LDFSAIESSCFIAVDLSYSKLRGEFKENQDKLCGISVVFAYHVCLAFEKVSKCGKNHVSVSAEFESSSFSIF
jgi:hypothetical protein